MTESGLSEIYTFFHATLNTYEVSRLKNLLLTLLIFPIILLAQEQVPFSEPNHNQPTQPTVHTFDARCIAPMQWSSSLIFARQSGSTVDYVIQDMVYQYNYGNLQGISDDTLNYMLSIISAIYGHESVETEEEIIHVLRHVEELCVEFIEAREEADKITA